MDNSRSPKPKTDYRVRRAKDKSAFIGRLIESGVFPTMRDAIGFAAAVGYSIEKRQPFEGSDDQIQWATFVNRSLQEDLVGMIAAATVDDVEILGDDRLGERISILEEFSNAGLEYLELSTGTMPLVDALTKLILDQEKQDIGLTEILDELAGNR